MPTLSKFYLFSDMFIYLFCIKRDEKKLKWKLATYEPLRI